MYTLDRLLKGGMPEANSTLDHPLEHLVACHSRIEERLRTLERAAQVLDTKPEIAFEAIANTFRYFETSGVMHTADEEESAFPRMLPRLSESQRGQIGMLQQQHLEADRIYNELKAVAEALRQRRQPELAAHFLQIVERFCGLYRAHMAFENEELIRMGHEVLTSAEIQQISQEMKRRRGLL